jgi:mevalonate kinase
VTGSAPGKAILFGEHAVVYGYPAIAVPIRGVAVQATVSVLAGDEPGSVTIEAPDIDYAAQLDSQRLDDPLQLAVKLALEECSGGQLQALTLRIVSDIPVASGMGSSAAVSVAILRGVAAHFGTTITAERTSELAYEVEKLHHGTPSGIDNTVIAFGRSIYFVKDVTLEQIRVPRPFTLLLGDTGKPSPTRELVAAVRQRWLAEREPVEAVFRSIGELSRQARAAIETGEISALGPLMSRNQSLLQEIGVSSPELDQQIEAALEAGALGAKLSGAGGGGTMIALVEQNLAAPIGAALLSAGASRVITSEVSQ